MIESETKPGNHLFDALSLEARTRLLPHMQLMPMPLAEVLYDAGDALSHMYFPTDSVIALVYVLENGTSADIALVGNEGVVGLSLFMGGNITPSRAVVQCAGSAYRLAGQHLREEFKRDSDTQQLVLRYTQSLITQMAQTAVCNRHHVIEQQLCRLLLQSLDRLADNRIVMTHELIAQQLGVRREGITEAIGKLQKSGVIECSRGLVTVVNRSMLEELSCECYEVVKREANRLLPYRQSTDSRQSDHRCES